jgi:hypothetical protein
MDTDSWVKEYDGCKETTQEILQLIQARAGSLGPPGAAGGGREAVPTRGRAREARTARRGRLRRRRARAAPARAALRRTRATRARACAARQPRPCPRLPPPQERNINHPDGGPEASRMTAAARRKLGSLGTSLDTLFRWLDSPDAAAL